MNDHNCCVRTRIILSIRVRNPEVIEDYIPCIRVYDSIYLGNTVVMNRKDRAYIGITREKNLVIAILSIANFKK